MRMRQGVLVLLCLGVCNLALCLGVYTFTANPLVGPVKSLAPRRDRPRYNSGIELDKSGLKWTADLEAALAQGTKEKKRLLIAFEAIVDVNCRVNRMRF